MRICFNLMFYFLILGTVPASAIEGDPREVVVETLMDVAVVTATFVLDANRDSELDCFLEKIDALKDVRKWVVFGLPATPFNSGVQDKLLQVRLAIDDYIASFAPENLESDFLNADKTDLRALIEFSLDMHPVSFDEQSNPLIALEMQKAFLSESEPLRSLKDGIEQQISLMSLRTKCGKNSEPRIRETFLQRNSKEIVVGVLSGVAIAALVCNRMLRYYRNP